MVAPRDDPASKMDRLQWPGGSQRGKAAGCWPSRVQVVEVAAVTSALLSFQLFVLYLVPVSTAEAPRH